MERRQPRPALERVRGDLPVLDATLRRDEGAPGERPRAKDDERPIDAPAGVAIREPAHHCLERHQRQQQVPPGGDAVAPVPDAEQDGGDHDRRHKRIADHVAPERTLRQRVQSGRVDIDREFRRDLLQERLDPGSRHKGEDRAGAALFARPAPRAGVFHSDQPERLTEDPLLQPDRLDAAGRDRGAALVEQAVLHEQVLVSAAKLEAVVGDDRAGDRHDPRDQRDDKDEDAEQREIRGKVLDTSPRDTLPPILGNEVLGLADDTTDHRRRRADRAGRRAGDEQLAHGEPPDQLTLGRRGVDGRVRLANLTSLDD